MKIYSVRLSDDGLMPLVFTNVKALYNGLLNDGYEANTITMIKYFDNGGYETTEVKFTYANLVKVLRESSRGGSTYESAFIDCFNGGTMEVKEHGIVSK